jgi:hypothetical protein
LLEHALVSHLITSRCGGIFPRPFKSKPRNDFSEFVEGAASVEEARFFERR